MNKEEMNRIIGNTLQRHRIKNGYTQKQVYEKIGLAPKYISQIEIEKMIGFYLNN